MPDMRWSEMSDEAPLHATRSDPDAFAEVYDRYEAALSGTACRLSLAVYRLPAEAHMLWLAPDGKVVNHTLIRFPVYVGTHHPAPGTVPLPRQCGSSG